MLSGLIQRIAMDLGFLLTSGLIYYYFRRNVTYLMGSTLIGIATFALVYVLGKNEFGIATGIGLFAIFGILRYRTEQVPIVEMTYIFISITISVVTALADDLMVTTEMALLINGILIGLSSVFIFINQQFEETQLEILIDDISWIKLDETNRIKFLSEKFDRQIRRYQIMHVDYLRETSKVILFFRK